MGVLLSFIPQKDIFYGALLLLALAAGAYEVHHLKAEGAAHEISALQASSAKLQAEAAKQIAENTANYAATVAAVTEKADADYKVSAAQHESDAQRLRDYDAYRRSHPAVGGPASAAAIADAGKSGATGIDDKFASLEQVALGVAGSNAHLAIALMACMQERDGLTGK